MKDWIEQSRAAANHLLQTSNSLADVPGDLTQRMQAYAEAESAALEYLEAVPGKLKHLRDAIAGAGQDVNAIVGDRESEAAREVRNLYRVALLIARNPEAREPVVDLSHRKASRILSDRFPDIWSALSAHLEDFAWVRSAGTGLEPTTTREALQRIQVALLRWDPETIGQAASAPDRDVSSLPDDTTSMVRDYLTVSGDLAFDRGLPVKARWMARRFFEEVAAAIGCSLRQVLNAPVNELLSALESGTALPAEPAAEPGLSGQAVSLGRAVGRVRVILDADEGDKLRAGDIVVTSLSTPNYEGQPSIFPYRTVPSVSVDRAAAVVTDEGGLLSHAAIICRENQVPAILGAEGASSTLSDGMIVEVDATRAEGSITVLARELP